LALSVAAVVVLGVVLLLILQTPPAKRAVAERLASALTAASGFQVQIGGLDGTLPFDAEIADVRVSDADGAWLTVDRLALGWRMLDLLAGRLHVTGLAVRTSPSHVCLPPGSSSRPTSTASIFLSACLNCLCQRPLMDCGSSGSSSRPLSSARRPCSISAGEHGLAARPAKPRSRSPSRSSMAAWAPPD
jgi:hypothetical protein